MENKMKQVNKVQKTIGEKIDHNWKKYVYLSGVYASYRGESLTILNEFLFRFDGHLCLKRISEQRIKQTPINAQSMRYVFS